MRFKQRYCPKSKNSAGYKSTSFARALMDLSRRHKAKNVGQQYRSKQHISLNNASLSSRLACATAAAKSSGNPNMQSYGGTVKKKWAKRLASDLICTPYSCVAKSKAEDKKHGHTDQPISAHDIASLPLSERERRTKGYWLAETLQRQFAKVNFLVRCRYLHANIQFARQGKTEKYGLCGFLCGILCGVCWFQV
ncbi:hypothetical protein L7F22_064208 [Adiantum nelumboides]|nr:hypothetical protein [Adiantum nelumboides]